MSIGSWHLHRPVPGVQPPQEPAPCSQGSGLAEPRHSPGKPAGGALAQSLLSPEIWNTICTHTDEDKVVMKPSSGWNCAHLRTITITFKQTVTNVLNDVKILPVLVCQPYDPCPLVFPRMQLFQGLLPLGNDITDLAKEVESVPS